MFSKLPGARSLYLAFWLLLSVFMSVANLEAQETMNCKDRLESMKTIFLKLKESYSAQSSNYAEALHSVKQQKKELEDLERYLQILRGQVALSLLESDELKKELAILRTGLIELETKLTQAEDSLKKASESWKDYKEMAEEKLRKAEQEKVFWQILAIITTAIGATTTGMLIFF